MNMSTDELRGVVEAWAMEHSNLPVGQEYFGMPFDPINEDADCAFLLYELERQYHLSILSDSEAHWLHTNTYDGWPWHWHCIVDTRSIYKQPHVWNNSVRIGAAGVMVDGDAGRRFAICCAIPIIKFLTLNVDENAANTSDKEALVPGALFATESFHPKRRFASTEDYDLWREAGCPILETMLTYESGRKYTYPSPLAQLRGVRDAVAT